MSRSRAFVRGWIVVSLVWIGAVVWYDNAINALIYPIETFRNELIVQLMQGAKYKEDQIANFLRIRELFLLTTQALVPPIVLLLAGLGVIWAMRRFQIGDGGQKKPN